MIRKKPAPHLMRGVHRFSAKIMRKQEANAVSNFVAVAEWIRAGSKDRGIAQRDRTMQATDFIVARNDFKQCKRIETRLPDAATLDRKSTRLNSSHIPLSRMPSSA